MQSFMLSSKSAQFLEYMDLRTRTINALAFGPTGPGFESRPCHYSTG